MKQVGGNIDKSEFVIPQSVKLGIGHSYVTTFINANFMHKLTFYQGHQISGIVEYFHSICNKQKDENSIVRIF